MATATPPRPIIHNRADTDRRVRDPLHALRGFIRRYVTLEGLGVAVLFLAIWFWVGMALDYGIFVLASFDWIQELQSAVDATTAMMIRVVLVGILAAGLIALVAVKVILRLIREFSDNSLALLLERRFPKVLGDRLITAVEMADPKLSKKYGYSQPMLDRTIADAADRVEQVPVKAVFNTGRLWKLWALALTCVFGVYVLVSALWIGVGTAVDGPAADATFRWRLWDAYAIWIERNVFLSDTYWPRRAHLEVIRFSDSDRHPNEMYVARNENRPPIKVRAYQWVIADRESSGGWRPLMWNDLPQLFKGANADVLKKVHLPPNWGGWTIGLDYFDASIPNGVAPDSWNGKTAQEIRTSIRKTLLKHPGELLDWLDDAEQKSFDPLRAANIRAVAKRIEAITAEVTKDKNDKDAAPKTASKDVDPLAARLPNFEESDWSNLNAVRDLAKADAAGAVEQLLKWQTWSVDRLDRQLQDDAVRVAMKENHLDSYKALEDVFSRLEEMCEWFSMSRTLRKLNVPEQVQISFQGENTRLQDSQTSVGENVYYFNLDSLDESASFYVRGDNFYTPTKKIKLQEPPAVDELTVDKNVPAYIHYRLKGDQEPLAGKRLAIRDEPQKVDGNSTAFRVPIGTNLVLHMHSSRELKGNIRVVAATRRRLKGSKTPQQPVEKGESPKLFSMAFPQIMRPYEFYFEFYDLDGIKGQHRVQIEPVDDAPPKFEEFALDVKLRSPFFKTEPGKTRSGAQASGLLITPNAYLPIRGKVIDDYGLHAIEWDYSYEQVDFSLVGGGAKSWVPRLQYTGNPAVRRSRIAATAFHMNPLTPGFGLFGQEFHAIVGWMAEMDLKYSDSEMGGAGLAMLPGFQSRLQNSPGLVTIEQLMKKKDSQTPKGKLLSLYDLKNDNFFRKLNGDIIRGFDLPAYLPQLETVAGEKQQHYSMTLYVRATDNNVEVGHQSSKNLKALTFLVVSEEELLAQVLLEEFTLYKKLVGAYGKLRDHLAHVKEQVYELEQTRPGLSGVADRIKQARYGINKASDMTKDALENYKRILEELTVNRVRDNKIRLVADNIVDPLTKMTNGIDGEFFLQNQREQDLGTRERIGDFTVVEDALSSMYELLNEDVNRLRKAVEAGDENSVRNVLDSLRPKFPQYREKARETRDKLELLSNSMDRVLKTLDKGMDYEKLLEILVDLVEDHNRVNDELNSWFEHVEAVLFDELFGPKKK